MCNNDHIQNMKQAQDAGFRVQLVSNIDGALMGTSCREAPFSFNALPTQYRIHPDDLQAWRDYNCKPQQTKTNSKAHVHAELIKAWADGAQLQYKDGCGDWQDTGNPSWCLNAKYRIKPEQTDIQKYGVEVGDVWSTVSGVWFIAGFSGTDALRTLQGYLVTKRSLQQLRFRRGVVNKL